MERTMQFSIVLVLLLMCEINSLENYPTVHTKFGQIKGSIMYTISGNKIYTFRGINYAQPPTVNLRFKPSVPVSPWNDVYDASKEGPACPQKDGAFRSESCLTLNIYTKKLANDSNALLPVIAFLPPGGFFQLSAQSFNFGPNYLLDDNIVLVTINYRLGTLGFLNMGTKYAPGNYALKDQIMALRFIRDHISSFGGDPKSVTLSGHSSGGRSITLHLVSPMSKGLFHRAILLSGSMTTPIPPPRTQINLAVKQAKLLNCTTETTEKMFRCFENKSFEEFEETYSDFYIWRKNPELIWYPSVEPEILGTERFLTDEPEKLFRSRQMNNVPVIIGTTKDEFSYMATEGIREVTEGDDTYFKDLNERWENLAPICFQYENDTNRSKFISRELHKFYFNNQPITLNNSDALRNLYANAIGHFPIYRSVNLLAKYSTAPVYFYVFDYLSPRTEDSWKILKDEVAHGDDMQYIFTTKLPIFSSSYSKTFPVYYPNDTSFFMVKRMTKMWTHFAKTNEPIPKGSDLFQHVTWKRFTPEHKNYLSIGRNITLKSHFLDDVMKFWDKLFP